MKIVFFGTGEFSAHILRDLYTIGDVEICAVVSQPDKPVGRKQEYMATPVKQLAQEKNTPIYQPEILKNNTDFFETLTKLGVDFFVVVAYGKKIPLQLLDIPKYFPLNIHGSLLPKYRGASPVQEALKNGDSMTGLTIMEMTHGMDEGPYFKQAIINVDKVDTALSIFQKMAQIGANLVVQVMRDIIVGKDRVEFQDPSQVSFCSKIDKEDGHIFFTKQSAKQIFYLFQAYYIWPGIFTYFEGKKLQILACSYNDSLSGAAGSVSFENSRFGIFTQKGLLYIQEVKLEGKKAMSIHDFLHGYQNKVLSYQFE